MSQSALSILAVTFCRLLKPFLAIIVSYYRKSKEGVAFLLIKVSRCDLFLLSLARLD